MSLLTVEFNEDLSALHGSTIQTQAEYVSAAISFILALYPPPRRTITLIGHSMGGIVAHLVIASHNNAGWDLSDIAAIITMSTPHGLAPARLDTEIERIYRHISRWEHSRQLDGVPILSICGGSTDSQIPSETCTISEEHRGRHRRTVYTTSAPGVWTGVGHREIVWCHQVRWRVARAALDLGNAGKNTILRSKALYRWFPPPSDDPTASPDLVEAPSGRGLDLSNNSFTVITSATLHVSGPKIPPHVYLMPVPGLQPRILSLLISRGSLIVPSLASHGRPQQPGSLTVSLYECVANSPHGAQPDDPASSSCKPLGKGSSDDNLTAYSSQLLPLPVAGSDFPGKEGVEESDVAVYFRASFRGSDSSATWIAIRIEGGLDHSGQEWLVAGFDQEKEYEASIGFSGKSSISFCCVG